MSSLLALKVESYLTPLLGKTMAHSTVKVQCKNIGVTPEELSVEHLGKLTERIEKGLIIFIGTEKAKKATEAIKRFT